MAASTGLRDIVSYFVRLWNGTDLAFHTTERGEGSKTVLQVTREAGGDQKHGYNWLLDHCRELDGRKLIQTSGKPARAQEEKRTGMHSKAVQVATRLNTTKGGSKGGSKGSSKDDGKESGGTKGKTGKIGKAAETYIGWDGRRL